MLTSRAFGVIPMALLHNLRGTGGAGGGLEDGGIIGGGRGDGRLSGPDLFIIWWSGLGRGAVSVAMVYFYFDAGKTGDGHRETVIVR